LVGLVSVLSCRFWDQFLAGKQNERRGVVPHRSTMSECSPCLRTAREVNTNSPSEDSLLSRGLGGAAAVFIMRGDKRKHLPVFVKSNTAIPPGDDSSQYPTLLVLTFQVPNPISYSINKRDILAAVAPGCDVSSPAGVEVCGVCRRAGGSRGAGLQACSAAGRMYPPPSRPDTINGDRLTI